MKNKHSRSIYANLTIYQMIILFLAIVFSISFILSSILFDVGMKLYVKGIALLEQELEGNISWKNAHITPAGTFVIQDFYLYRKKSDEFIQASSTLQGDFVDQDVMLYARSLRFNLNPLIAVRYGLIPFEKISEHDRERLEIFFNGKRNLNYFVMKMLRSIEISTIGGEMSFPDDNHLIELLDEMLFTKKLLPWDCDLILNDIGVRINTPVAAITTKDFDLSFNLSDFKGIHAEFVGNTNFTKFNQDVFLDIEGKMGSTDFFENIDLYTNIENIMYNALIISPVEVNLNKAPAGVTFSVEAVDTHINVVGSIVDNIVDVDLHMEEANLGDIFKLDLGEIFSIQEDRLTGTGRLVSDLKKKTLSYELKVKNNEESKNDIDINVYGDENFLNFSDVIVKISNQYVIAQGSLSLLHWGLNGNIDFALDKPLLEKPIRGDFAFYNTLFSSVGTSSGLYINNMKQDDIRIEYSSVEQFLTVALLESKDTSFFDLRYSGEKKYDILIRDFPLRLATSFMNTNDIKLINNYYVNSTLSFTYTNSKISDMRYDLGIFHRNKLRNYIKAKGIYDNNLLKIDNMSFYFFEKKLFNGSVSGDIYLSFYNRVLQPLDLELVLYEDNIPSVYDISMDFLRNSAYRISINENLNIDVGFKGDAMLRNIFSLDTVEVVANNFSIPYTDFMLSSQSNVQLEGFTPHVMNLDLKIDSLENNQHLFAVMARYENMKGTISNFMLANKERAMEGLGSFSYNPNTQLISANIIETSSIDDKVGISSDNTIESQSVDISYGIVNKNINIKARNITLGTFTNKVNGVINGDFLIDLKNKNAFGEVLPSTISSKTQKYNMSMDFYLDRLDDQANLTINKLTVINGNSEYFFPVLTVDKFRYMDTSFTLNKLVRRDIQEKTVLCLEYIYCTETENKDIYEITYEGSIFFNSDKSVLSIIDNLDENPLTVINNFNASVILNPVLLKNPSIARKYRYNIQVQNKSGVMHIEDIEHNVFIELNNHTGKLQGYIGHNDSIFQANINGKYDFKVMDIKLDIKHLDIGKFDDEYWDNKNIIHIDDMYITGSLSLRGSNFDPSIYGYLEINPLSGYMPFFDKYISFKNVRVLFSDNDISLINSYIEVDRDQVFVNMHGKMNGFSLDGIQLNVFSDDDGYKAKKMRLGKTEVSGLAKGSVKVLVENGVLEIFADTSLSNALVSNERYSQKQLKAIEAIRTSPSTPITVVADIKVLTGKGVVFAWPSSIFPVLKAGFAGDQEINILYDGFIQEFSVLGDLSFDSGTIYYFDQPFNIKNLKIAIDEYNLANDPFVDTLEAEATVRYNDQRYVLFLKADATKLSDMEVKISSNPYLSNNEISAVFGKNIVPNSNVTDTSIADVSSTGLVSSLVKISDPITNIGIFSRFGNTLQRSLQLDYLAFRSQVVQNLLDYSVNSNSINSTNAQTSLYSYSLVPYLLNNSTVELGKYIDIIYLNFQIELNIANSLERYNTNALGVSWNTAMNVEMPTPFFNLTWTGTLRPNAYYTNNYIPVNLLTISWQKRY